MPRDSKWPWWRLAVMGLGVLAFLLSLLLSWHFLTGGSMIGCSGGTSCDEVLQSRWSLLAGVLPVSSLAIGLYLALLASTLYIGPATEMPVRLMAWNVLMVLSGAILGSAIWFTVVQKWFIGAFCPYCMSAHITGVVVSVLLLVRALKEVLLKPRRVIGFFVAGMLLSGLMAVVQVAVKTPVQYNEGETPESLPLVNVQEAPIIGSRDATHTIYLLFDYNCAHCQKIHFMVQEVVERYKGKVAFVLCPTPLNTHCNAYVPKDVDAFSTSCELARIGLAVWRAKPAAFADFENWMFTYDSGDRWKSRTPEAATSKAIELVGKPAFESALADPWIGAYMESCVRLFGHTLQSGKGGIPKLVYGSRWVIPQPATTDQLMSIVQTSFSLPKP